MHLLHERKLTLLNPATWDDKNDAYFMAEYKRGLNAKSVLALCFAECGETYHHWRVFSHGPDGVCIEFNKAALLDALPHSDAVRHGYVKYKTISETKSIKSINIEKLPFIKRYPYYDEQEYRVIYVSHKKSIEHKSIPIDLSCITRIRLSPWMSPAVEGAVISSLNAIPGCREIKIRRSSLVNNETWKQLASRAV
jgi:hypothetical protein